MKKLVFLIPVVLLITGCGNKVTCTTRINETNTSYDIKITAYINENDKVESGKVEFNFDTKDGADQLCSMYKSMNSLLSEKIDVNCNNKKVVVNSLSPIEDDTKVVGLTKEKFIKQFKSIYKDGNCK